MNFVLILLVIHRWKAKDVRIQKKCGFNSENQRDVDDVTYVVFSLMVLLSKKVDLQIKI